MVEIQDWYSLPLYYDIIFDEDTDLEADFLEQVFSTYSEIPCETLLEPACGSGRLVREMTRRGFRMTGYDLSEHMLAFTEQRLRESKQKATLINGNMADCILEEPVDGAFSLVSTFKYLMAEDEVMGHFKSMAQSLKPGAIYALGFHVSSRDQKNPMREVWSGKRDGVSVLATIDSDPPEFRKRRERVEVTLEVNDKGKQGTYTSEWWFRTYTNRQVKKMLKDIASNFELLEIHDFTYDMSVTHTLSDDQLDRMLILSRK